MPFLVDPWDPGNPAKAVYVSSGGQAAAGSPAWARDMLENGLAALDTDAGDEDTDEDTDEEWATDA